MDVVKIHDELIAYCTAFTSGSAEIQSSLIKDHMKHRRRPEEQWPEPYLLLDPSFTSGGSSPGRIKHRLLSPEGERIFLVGKDGDGGQPLRRHGDALEIARTGASCA
ncbi:hypothetical protein [Nonomuraea sp. NPDC050786]|uniref:hypothetical protein n=1 Tax=Nonomuraea sp. NPDC050786 TaxID=3154840 RepID=UPI0033FC7ECE